MKTIIKHSHSGINVRMWWRKYTLEKLYNQYLLLNIPEKENFSPLENYVSARNTHAQEKGSNVKIC